MTPTAKMRRVVAAQRSRALKRGLISTLTAEEWEAILIRSGGRCHYCGDEVGIDNLSLDHVLPLRRGGHNAAANVVAACKFCNCSKNASNFPAYMNKPRVKTQTQKELNQFHEDIADARYALSLNRPGATVRRGRGLKWRWLVVDGEEVSPEQIAVLAAEGRKTREAWERKTMQRILELSSR